MPMACRYHWRVAMRTKRAVLSAAALLILATVIPMSASAHNQYPVSPQTRVLAGPMNYPGTGNTWCPKAFEGSYSTALFAQTVSYVNYGGTCNAQWGYPPAGTLWAIANEYNWGATALLGSNTGYNTVSQRTHAHAAITHHPNGCMFFTTTRWKYSGGSWSGQGGGYHTCSHP